MVGAAAPPPAAPAAAAAVEAAEAAEAAMPPPLCPSPPSETMCYYDETIPDLDAEARFADCDVRCRIDVHLPPAAPAAPDGGDGGGSRPPVLLFVHGGTWRVGDRRSAMFSGRHAALAQYYNVVVLSVGYRRTRMPCCVFFGLYPVRPRPQPLARPRIPLRLLPSVAQILTRSWWRRSSCLCWRRS